MKSELASIRALLEKNTAEIESLEASLSKKYGAVLAFADIHVGTRSSSPYKTRGLLHNIEDLSALDVNGMRDPFEVLAFNTKVEAAIKLLSDSPTLLDERSAASVFTANAAAQKMRLDYLKAQVSSLERDIAATKAKKR